MLTFRYTMVDTEHPPALEMLASDLCALGCFATAYLFRTR